MHFVEWESMRVGLIDKLLPHTGNSTSIQLTIVVLVRILGTTSFSASLRITISKSSTL